MENVKKRSTERVINDIRNEMAQIEDQDLRLRLMRLLSELLDHYTDDLLQSIK